MTAPGFTAALPARPTDAPTRDPTSQPLIPAASRAASYLLELGTGLAQVASAGIQATSAFAAALPAPWTESISARLRLGTPANNQPSVQTAGAGAPTQETGSLGSSALWLAGGAVLLALLALRGR